MSESVSGYVAACGVVVMVALAGGSLGCRRSEPSAQAMATPGLTLNHDKAPLGSALDIKYRFEVSKPFDQDYHVFVHVVDPDGDLMWNDDHLPPVPTSQWKAGTTVEYTRTVFVPIYPYVGEATFRLGMYSTATQKRLPLGGDDAGQREYRVGHVLLQPQTENIFTVFKDGWHPTEVAERNATLQWQWTRKAATVNFRNPGKACVLYLDVDTLGKPFDEPQQVTVSLGGLPLETFTLKPGGKALRKVAITKDQLGSVDMEEIQLTVDKTFVPAQIDPSNFGKDTRELGIRVYHAFVDAR